MVLSLHQPLTKNPKTNSKFLCFNFCQNSKRKEDKLSLLFEIVTTNTKTKKSRIWSIGFCNQLIQKTNINYYINFDRHRQVQLSCNTYLCIKKNKLLNYDCHRWVNLSCDAYSCIFLMFIGKTSHWRSTSEPILVRGGKTFIIKKIKSNFRWKPARWIWIRSKDQLISKCRFVVIVLTKIPPNFFNDFCHSL